VSLSLPEDGNRFSFRNVLFSSPLEYGMMEKAQTLQRENFQEHLKMLIDNAIIYYITEFKHPEISIISEYYRYEH
jgi:hypothetical protein